MQIRDQVGIGIIIGAVFPIIGYFLLEALFNLLTDYNLMDEVSSSSLGSRKRTLYLLAICCNLIFFNIFKRQRKDNAMRGLGFPTLLYAGFWIYLFQDVIMANF